MNRNRKVGLAATIAAMSLLTTGCLGGGSGGGGEGDDTVTIWTSMDQPVVDGLEATLEEKASEAGIDVKWERVTGIDKLIMTKLQASDKPDIAVLPQPGVVANVVKRDGAFPLDDVLDMGALEESMFPGIVDAGTVDGEYYGLQINASVKSVVFYPKKAWDEAGYPTPASLDELAALTEQIKSDGGTPWCLGIFSEGSVGWPATDWIEDLVAQTAGAEVYNQWVEGEVKFDSPEVREAAEWFETNVLAEGNVPGGRRGVASTDFGAAANPMFKSGEPGCWMLKQGTFITGFFPDNIQQNLDEEVGVFAFPPAEEGSEKYVVGGGDLATMLSDDENTKEVMKMLAESDIGTEAAKTGAYISPHADFDPSGYPTEIMRTAYTSASEADAFLFDGSDQMPGEVGAGTFWSEMTSWISGDTDLETALQNIDASWPAS